MRIVFDTNVVLDVLLDRDPWSKVAAELFSRVESGFLEGYLCATTVTTIHYLAAKSVGKAAALQEIRKLLSLFDVAPITGSVLKEAVELDFTDFADAVLYQSGLQVNAQAIVTRNPTDFKTSKLPVLTPDELARTLVRKDSDLKKSS